MSQVLTLLILFMSLLAFTFS